MSQPSWRAFLRNYSKLLYVILALAAGWAILAWLGTRYRPLSPQFLLSKEGADALKTYILGWGTAAPAFFIGIQVVQVLIAPIPGQAAGFVGGFVFGWPFGTLYSMTGLALGSWIVFFLSRRYGRAFAEKLNAGQALKDFEELLSRKAETAEHAFDRSKKTISSHPLLTFFLIMLLPGLPDDVVCFAAGLSNIPIWQLLIAAVAGRFPGMLALSMAGAGFSRAETRQVFIGIVVTALVLTVLYLWQQRRIQRLVQRLIGLRPGVSD
jgi:uncharacterized membrane protein YdjX (TVP38/TMEM64 family)